MAEKYLDYSGTDLLWRKIIKILNRKIESVESADDSIKVENKNEVSVKISESEGNVLRVEQGKGLYVPNTAIRMHKLTFGSDQDYVYDGSEDVTVPVYPGTYSE